MFRVRNAAGEFSSARRWAVARELVNHVSLRHRDGSSTQIGFGNLEIPAKCSARPAKNPSHLVWVNNGSVAISRSFVEDFSCRNSSRNSITNLHCTRRSVTATSSVERSWSVIGSKLNLDSPAFGPGLPSSLSPFLINDNKQLMNRCFH